MTDWNVCYTEGNTPWNKGTPSPPLAQYLGNHPLTGRVLVPGCGAGHDAAFLVRQGSQVTGVDLAPLALEMARQNYPELPPETWHLGDLFALPDHFTGAFDAVVEHTCLCALPPTLRRPYRDTAHAVLKPGGLLIGVWFINPDLDPDHEGPPHPLPLTELEELFADGFEIVTDYVPDVAFDGREGRERLRVLRKVSA